MPRSQQTKAQLLDENSRLQQEIAALKRQAPSQKKSARLAQAQPDGRTESQRLELLRAIDLGIIAGQDLHSLAASVLNGLPECVPGYCAGSAVLQVGDEMSQIDVLALHANSPDLQDDFRKFVLEPALASGQPKARPMVINSLRPSRKSSPHLNKLATAGVSACLAAPICSGEATLGTLTLLSCEAHAFPDDLVQFIQEVANSLGLAVERQRKGQEDQQRILEAEAMRDVMAAVASAGNLSQILEIILVNLGNVIGYDRAGLFLLDENQRYVLADQPSPGHDKPVRTYLADDPIVSLLRETHRPVFMEDIQAEAHLETWTDMQPVRAWLGAPLLVGDEMIGILSLGSLRPGAYGEAEAEIVQSFTRQAAQVLENAWLQEQSTRRTEELEVLTTISFALGQAENRQSALETIVEQITRHFGADRGIFLLPDREEAHLVVRASQEESLLGASHPLGEDPLSQAFLSGEVEIIQDAAAFLASENAGLYPALMQGMRSAVFIPIRWHDAPLGLLGMAFLKRRSLKSGDINLYQTIAEISGTYLSRAVSLEAIEKQLRVRTRHLSTLYDINAIASEPLPLTSILDRILGIALASLNSPCGAIHLLESPGTLRLVSHQRLPEPIQPHLEMLSLDENPWKSLLAGSNPLVVPDIREDPRLPDGFRRPDFSGPFAYLAAPIRAKGQALGLLSLFGDSVLAYSVEDMTLFMTIADQIGQSVERARLINQAEQAAVMEERQRLARELHDSVTQLLYSQVLFAGAGLKVLDQGNLPPLKQHLRRIDQNALQALKEMRLLVFELSPSNHLELGLVGALQRRLDSVEKRTGMNARLFVSGPIDLQPATELALYRIAQEALNNTLKHAGASLVEVRLRQEPNLVQMEITDNGCGFDLEEKLRSGGMGLLNMQERTAGLGGDLQIQTVPGQGTSIIATIQEAA